jgi:RNA polymerase sigma factor (sigma-70 family)
MTPAATTTLVQHVRRSAGPAARPLTDRQLLRRYALRRDPDDFAALVRRHGSLVLAACRRVLSDPADVDDAFQATFLVLLRQAGAKPWRACVGGWLYATAHRVALRARANAARRRLREGQAARTAPADETPPDLSWREACDLLHQELGRLPERYRLPLLLCYLEGLSRDEAARRLGWTVTVLRGRLERGRDALRRRLERRGVGLTAGLLAVVAGGATVSPALARSAADLAAGDAPSAGAALLAAEAAPSTASAAAKLLAVVLTVAAVGAALWARTIPADPPAPPAAEPPRAPAAPAPGAPATEVAGRVLDADGKPVAGARVLLPKFWPDGEAEAPGVAPTTDADGRFRLRREPSADPRPFQQLVAVADGFGPDWVYLHDANPGEVTLRLPKDDVPVEGRVLDLEGKPVAGATARLTRLETTTEGLEPVFQAMKAYPYSISDRPNKRLYSLAAVGLGTTVTTGADGRFRFTGAGRERFAVVRVEGPTIESQVVRAVTRPGFDPKSIAPTDEARMMPGMLRQPTPKVFGPRFDLTAGPTKPVTGVVRDAKTGEPLAGVRVSGSATAAWWENHVTATTDAQGRYRLAGLPKAPEFHLTLFAGENRPYLPAGTAVSDTPGLAPIAADFVMAKGVMVSGRVTERGTGKPVRASLRYLPLADNKFFANTPGKDIYRFASLGDSTDAEGRFRLVALPGSGVILAQANDIRNSPGRYKQARIRPEDQGKASRGNGLDAFTGVGGAIETLMGYQAYKLIDPPAGAAPVTCDLEFEAGREITGRVLDPDGQPLAGALATGQAGTLEVPVPLAGSEFRAVAIDPDKPRTLAFLHRERKLVGTLTVRGDEKEPAVKLRPWGVLTGRVVDAEGQPVAGAAVFLLYRNEALRTLQIQVMASPGGPPVRYVQTDRDGRFRVEGVVPGEAFALQLTQQFMLLRMESKVEGVTLQPGETKDLGEVKTKGTEG